MDVKDKEFFDALYMEKDVEKACQIADEMIVEQHSKAGAVCNSLTWDFIEKKEYKHALRYALIGSKLDDKGCLHGMAMLYYQGGGVLQDFNKAYEYLLKAKDAGEEIPDYVLEMYKSKVGNKSTKTETKQGCYIATCVYGSYDCPQVWTLRRYRDFVLSKKWYGRFFIKAYYALSPYVVTLFGKNMCMKRIWKKRLDSWIIALNNAGINSEPYEDRR